MGECSVEGCSNKRKYAKTGWCSKHYIRWWKYGDLTYTERDTSPRRVPTEPSDLGYLAGLIDGEGCLRLTKAGYYHLSVHMCDQEVVQWLCTTLGGKLSVYKPKRAEHRTSYTWQSNNQGYLRDLLCALEPYMKLESKKRLIRQMLQ